MYADGGSAEFTVANVAYHGRWSRHFAAITTTVELKDRRIAFLQSNLRIIIDPLVGSYRNSLLASITSN